MTFTEQDRQGMGNIKRMLALLENMFERLEEVEGKLGEATEPENGESD